MRVLGIDPGSRTTGYGVIASQRQTSTYLTSGCIRTESKDFPARLGEIFSQLSDVIAATQPDQVAIEQVFVAKNAGAALKLGQARGAAITAAVTRKLPVFEYSARSVKQALVGTGAADKTQVQHMVKLMLSQQHQMGLDESDALAVALCHAHHQHFLNRVNQP